MTILSADTQLCFTAVPNAFIDRYMSENSTFVVVYLYFYRHCMGGGGSVSTGDAADHLRILESDVMKGLYFWQEKNLLQMERRDSGLMIRFLAVEPSGNDPSTKSKPELRKETDSDLCEEEAADEPIDSTADCTVTENTLKDIPEGNLSEKTEPEENKDKKTSGNKKGKKEAGKEKLSIVKTAVPEEAPVQAEKQNETQNEPEPFKPVLLQSRPRYEVQELEIYKANSEEIRHLFSMAEKAMGKMLSYNDLNVVFGLHDWLRLPLGVIDVLFQYCTENEHRNLSYIEKVAIDWAENGINTVDGAIAHIKLYNGDYREILKAFGLPGRHPVSTEIRFMKKWLQECQMPLPVILEACDKTVMAIGKPNFLYADRIISEWHAKGVRDMDGIKKSEDTFYQEKASPEKSRREKRPAAGSDSANGGQKTYATSKPNRFVNFQQREWDYENIEKLERQYIVNSLRE